MALSQQQLLGFENLLATSLSNNNEERRAAERATVKQFETNKVAFVAGLTQLLRSSQVPQVRNLCAVYLRTKLPRGEPMLWDKLDSAQQSTVKSELLTALVSEPSPFLRRQVADTVSELAQITLYRGHWNELFPYLEQLASHKEASARQCAHIIFGKIADDAIDCLEPMLADIMGIYAKGLSDQDMMVRVAAVVATCTTVTQLEDDTAFVSFQQLIPPIMNVLTDLLSAQQWEESRRVLRQLVEIATHVSIFLKPMVNEIASLLSTVGTTSGVDDSVKRLCCNFFVSMAVDCPTMMRANPDVIKAAITLGLSLFLEVSDEADWANKWDPDFSLNPTGLFDSLLDTGMHAMDRLADSVGKKAITLILPNISNFVGSQDWKLRHAGLMCLSQIAESMEFQDIPVAQVLQFTKDPHPRVRYAALHCVGQLCTDFDVFMHAQHHEAVMKACLPILMDSRFPRLQAHSAAAIFNFLEKCEPDFVRPYVDVLVKSLLQLLENGHRMVQEQVLTTLAALAGAAQDDFDVHYATVVPYVKHIIQHAVSDVDAGFRARAMECVTFIGMAVGRDRFRQDALEVMRMFVGIMENSKNLKPDDVSLQYLLQSWTRLCSTLREEFVPCLKLVMPYVLEYARTECDLKFLDNDDDDLNSYQMNSKRFHGSLEVKIQGLSMLTSFLNDLKGHFIDYLQETAQIVIPLCEFYLSDEVRGFALAAMPDLVEATVKAAEAGTTNLQSVQSVYQEVMQMLISCTAKEKDNELLSALVQSIRQTVSVGGDLCIQCLDKDSIETIGRALMLLIGQTLKQLARRERTRALQATQLDEESLAELDSRQATARELNFIVTDTIGVFLKHFKDNFLPAFSSMANNLLEMLGSNDKHAQTIAIFIFDDVVEYTGPHASQYFQAFMPGVMNAVLSDHVELRQAAAYGLAQCAEHTGQYFAPYVPQALDLLLQAIRSPMAQREANFSAVDNAISAMGKICKFQSGAFNVQQGLALWLTLLPLRVDTEEAGFVYTYLCELIEENHPVVMANLAHALRALVQVWDTHMAVTDVLNGRIRAILQQVQGMPQEVLQALHAELTAEEKSKLQRAISGPQQASQK